MSPHRPRRRAKFCGSEFKLSLIVLILISVNSVRPNCNPNSTLSTNTSSTSDTSTTIDNGSHVFCFDKNQPAQITRRVLQDTISIHVDESLNQNTGQDKAPETQFTPPASSESVVDPIVSPYPYNLNDHQRFASNSYTDSAQANLTVSSNENRSNASSNSNQQPNDQETSASTIKNSEPEASWQPVSFNWQTTQPPKTTTAIPFLNRPTTKSPLVGSMNALENQHVDQILSLIRQRQLPSKFVQFYQPNPVRKPSISYPPSKANPQKQNFDQFSNFLRAQNPPTQQIQTSKSSKSKYLHLSDLIPFNKAKSQRLSNSRVKPAPAIQFEDLAASAQNSNFATVVARPQPQPQQWQQSTQNMMTAPQTLTFSHSQPQLTPHLALHSVLPQLVSAAGSGPLYASVEQLNLANSPQLQQQFAPSQSENVSRRIVYSVAHGDQQQQQQQQASEAGPFQSQQFNSINAQLPSAHSERGMKEQLELSDTGGSSQVIYSLMPNDDSLKSNNMDHSNNLDLMGSLQQQQLASSSLDHQAVNSLNPSQASLGTDATLLAAALEAMLKSSLAGQQQKTQDATIQQPSVSMMNNKPINLYQEPAQRPSGAMYAADENQNNPGYNQMVPPPDYYAERPRKKNKNKKKNPSLKVNKRPRNAYGQQPSSQASNVNPAFYNYNSNTDLQPSATFHKWKYPWLYRPDDEDEEEGETEVNIRFFNNFSRMGPFGTVARAGGGATLVVSLIFLILSNFSLAATVIAHGVSSFLRQFASPEKIKMNRDAKLMAFNKQSTTTSTTTRRPIVQLGTIKMSTTSIPSLASTTTTDLPQLPKPSLRLTTRKQRIWKRSTELDEEIESLSSKWL